MKKNRSFYPSMWKFMFVILLLAATNSFGQLLSENFEGGSLPSGWTSSSNTSFPWLFVNGTSGYGSGTHSARMDFYDISNGGNEQLTTKQFTATSGTEVLVMDEAYATYGNADDQLQILYSTDGGLTFTQLALLDGGDAGILNTGGDDQANSFAPASHQWQTLTFALPAGTNMIQFNGISAYGNDLYLDNIQVVGACSGIPNAGAAIAESGTTCPNTPFYVTLGGADNVPGLTYMWQYSTDNINYFDMPDATNRTLIATEFTATSYQCVITCTNSGLSATSTPCTPVAVSVNPLPLLQDFEGLSFPDQCFSESHNTNLPWAKSTTASAYGVGSNSVKMDFWDLPSGSEQLYTSQFEPSTTGYVLRFDEAYASALNYDDQLQILTSTDGGVTWTQLDLLDGGDTGPLNTGGDQSAGAFTPTSGQWKTFTYPLPIGTNIVQFNAISAYGNYLYLDNIHIFVPIPCTGTPTAGTTVSSNNVVGKNVQFLLSLSGADNSDGLTYDWQSSPDNITYTDIPGGVGNSLITSGMTDTWYQCVITCSNSGLSATSTPIFVQEHLAWTWTPLTNQAPYNAGGVMLLMTDGSVVCKSFGGGTSGYGDIWNVLTPDAHGSYINGTWSALPPMISDRYSASSCILKDGRLYSAGGEYGTDGTQRGWHGEVYDPLANTWTAINNVNPANIMSDGDCKLLDNGTVIQAIVDHFEPTSTVIFDPITNSYSPGPSTNSGQNESMWLKLPDNSILFVDEGQMHSERYIPSLNQWIHDADVPVELYDLFGYECGPGWLLPDGRAFFIGSTNTSAIYTPSGNTNPGTWTTGPTPPNGLGMPDAPGAMKANGNILFACSPAPAQGNEFSSPTFFYEFDYLTNTFTLVGAPYGGNNIGIPSYLNNLLDLPDGSVLYGNLNGGTQYFVYTPSGNPLTVGKPKITSIVPSNCTTYTITGTGFNGITEGAAFGDENQSDSNYPLIRLVSGTNVYYARSYNWNSTGVLRGSAPDTTHFTLPAGIPAGTYKVYVVANGNSSDPMNLTIGMPTQPGSISGTATPCNNSNQTYSITAVSGATSYIWTIPGGWIGTSTTNSINVNVIGTSGMITVKAVNACGSSTASTLAVTTVQNPAPVIIASGSLSICPGGSVTLSTGSFASYSWSNGGTTSSINAMQGGVYTVTVTTAAGCNSTAQRTVTMLLAPNPIITGTGITSYCNNLTTAVLTVGSFSSYLWNTNQVSQSIQVAPLHPGTYAVTVTSANGCSATVSTVLSNACQMPTGFSTTNIAATTAVANWSQPNCVYGYIIRISKHNANSWTSHQISPNSHYTFSGLAHNTLYDWQVETLCDASLNFTSGFGAIQTFQTAPRFEGGDASGFDYAFNVYPNPTHGLATIAFTSDKEEVYTICMMDVTGRVVLSASNSSVVGENSYQMNLNSIAKGMYMVVLQNSNGTLQKKLIIE